MIMATTMMMMMSWQVQLAQLNELTEYFGVPGDNCRIFVYLPLGEPLSHYDKADFSSKEELENWFWPRHRIKFDVLNDLDFDVLVSWESPDREEKFVATIPPVGTCSVSWKRIL